MPSQKYYRCQICGGKTKSRSEVCNACMREQKEEENYDEEIDRDELIAIEVQQRMNHLLN